MATGAHLIQTKMR